MDYLLFKFQVNKNKMVHYDIPLPAHAPKGSRTHINVQLNGTQLFLLVADFLSTCADRKNRCLVAVHKEMQFANQQINIVYLITFVQKTKKQYVNVCKTLILLHVSWETSTSWALWNK